MAPKQGLLQGWGFDETLRSMNEARRAGRGHALYYMYAWQRDLLRCSFFTLVCYLVWTYYFEGAIPDSARLQYTKIHEWIGDKDSCISVEMPGYAGS